MMINYSEKMVASCGMNCTYCYAHHKKKKPCLGCRMNDKSKPASCRKCKLKDCAIKKNIRFCYECDEYPCIQIKRLDKSYQIRYQESLINNMEVIKSKGMYYYLDFEKKRLKCPKCRGTLNLHHKICSECGERFNIDELS
jgi:hypothetical protein